MTNQSNAIRIAAILRRLDSELSAVDALYIGRHAYSPVKVLSRGCDPRPYLSGRLERVPDHHSWYSAGDLMWQALKIMSRLSQK